MDLLSVLLISIALAMDSFTVAIAAGTSLKKQGIHTAAKIGLIFGFFQGFMPLIGWLAGTSFSSAISDFDHWIAFGLLTVIGVHMIYESKKKECKKIDFLSSKMLALLGIATSIDALAVGLSFALLQIEIFSAIALIGIVSFAFSFTGFFIGKKAGYLLKGKAELAGGTVLILIALKILIEHLAIV